jgi:hypothetical protein
MKNKLIFFSKCKKITFEDINLFFKIIENIIFKKNINRYFFWEFVEP